jgi:minor extracellular serine protease Vpr
VLTGGGKTYRVPFAGYLGDYQGIKILDAGAEGAFPTIGRLTGVVSTTEPIDLTPVHTAVASGATFTMQNGDIPYVLAHFAHQARKVQIDLYDATTNTLVGQALTDQYRERNSRRTGLTNVGGAQPSDVYLAFAIDGAVKKGKDRVTVPNGSYYAVLSVQKALGDSANPAHTETWTSTPFTIARP